eukprot:TRINITY_DN38443_c0_g1_i1.p1 TRINITY_DN38443_c0_g1~~TRINITY_DN38443_c0_g1_i1.p1  ORF type:complete len:385 (+),score=64.76 TRINITY_DN38443_c0_g1_i1:47-1201(+)
MPQSRAWGMFLMICQGALLTLQLSLAKVLKETHWPYYRMLSGGFLASSVAVAIHICTRGVTLEVEQRKWVFLRGISGVSANLSLTLAVQWGTPLGDVASLTSINIIFAAVLGRLLLAEPLRLVHLISAALSVTGAVLISKPSFMFPGSSGQHTSWLGYFFGPAAGLFKACMYISSRKSGRTSPWMLALSTYAQFCIVFMILPLTPLVDDFSLAILPASPWQALGWFFALSMVVSVRVPILSLGAMLCPAAISATLDNASNMVLGYAVQIFIFKQTADPFSLFGAACMLVSVILMAVARSPIPQAADGSVSAVVAASDTAVGTEQEVEIAKQESLASFAASEFIEESPQEARLLRLRTTVASGIGRNLPDTRPIGVASLAAQATA